MKSKLFFSEIYPGQEKNFQNDSFYDLSSFQYESLRQEIINYIYFRDRNMSIQEMERKKIMIEFFGEFCFSITMPPDTKNKPHKACSSFFEHICPPEEIFRGAHTFCSYFS